MITTKNPLPGNLYLVRHSGGIRDVLLFIHDDGSASSVWPGGSGRLNRFRAFDNPDQPGSDDWLTDIRFEGGTFSAVFVKRSDRPVYMMSNREIFDIYEEFGVALRDI